MFCKNENFIEIFNIFVVFNDVKTNNELNAIEMEFSFLSKIIEQFIDDKASTKELVINDTT